MISVHRRSFSAAFAGTVAGDLIPGSADALPGPTGGSVVKHIRAGVLDVAYLKPDPPDGHPAFLLHGFPYDVHAYDAVAPRLAEGSRPVVEGLEPWLPEKLALLSRMSKLAKAIRYALRRWAELSLFLERVMN